MDQELEYFTMGPLFGNLLPLLAIVVCHIKLLSNGRFKDEI